MFYTHLPSRALMRLTGEDSVDFLQGLVSNDVTRLAQGGALYTALLTPQGKFLHDFFLIKEGDAIWLDVDASRRADLLQRFKMYRLRSRVEFTVPDPTMGVFAAWEKPVDKNGDGILPVQGLLAFSDPRTPLLGLRAVGDKSTVDAWAAGLGMAISTPEEYERVRLDVGVPEGVSDLIADKSFLLPFGFEQLHGVDFAKGCYVGQEVTARTKHLGQVRKSIYKVSSETDLPPAGTAVYAGDALAGEMRSVLEGHGLALLSVEEVEKARAAKAHLRAGDVAITASLPLWAKAVS